MLQRFLSNQIGEAYRSRERIVVLYSRINVGMVRLHLLLHKLDMVFHFRFAFSAVASACCRYVNWLSVTIPSDLVKLLIRQGSPFSTGALMSLASQLKRIISVFPLLTTILILQVEHHLSIPAQDRPSFRVRSYVFSPVTTTELSSANLIQQFSFIRKSLRNMIKRSGESTPPCSTPMLTRKVWDFYSPSSIKTCWFFKKASKIQNILPAML